MCPPVLEITTTFPEQQFAPVDSIQSPVLPPIFSLDYNSQNDAGAEQIQPQPIQQMQPLMQLQPIQQLQPLQQLQQLQPTLPSVAPVAGQASTIRIYEEENLLIRYRSVWSKERICG
jgi:hypothetical protein